MASFPASVYNPGTLQDGVDYPQAAHVNDLRSEVVAVEGALLNGITFPITSSTSVACAELSVSGGSTFGGAVTIAAGGLAVSTGAVTIGQGQIVFPAVQVPSASTTTMDDYRETTWTPADASGAGLALTVGTATYVKVGRLVIANFDITYPATANGATAQIGGLPTAAGTHWNLVSNTDASTVYVALMTAANNIQLNAGGATKTNANLSGLRIVGNIAYQAAN